MELTITGPKTLVLTPTTLALVLDSLAEKPFRIAQPAIQEIVSQLTKEPQNEQPSASSSRPVAPSVNSSDNGSGSALNGAGLRSNGARSEVRDSDRCGGESTGIDHQWRNDTIPS